jgi:hypothetical protein
MSKKKLLQKLKLEVVEITFTKKDNTIRNMKCTQNFDLIPKEEYPNGNRVVKDKNIVCVYDVEVNGWRSFNYKSLIK